MAASVRRHAGLKMGWLPVLAIVAATGLRLSLGTGHAVPTHPASPASLPAPASIQPGLPAVAVDAQASQFRAPTAVAVRGSRLYLSDVPTSAIWTIDLGSGAEVVIAGALGAGYSGDGGPALEAQLTEPRGLVLDAAGDLYIADSGNHAVRKIDVTGTMTTVAGDGTRGFSGDGGPANAAHLDTPTAVAVDLAGNLYIADTLNHRIRKVDLAGNIDTVAGSGVWSIVGGAGGFGFSGDGGPAVEAQLSIPEGLAVGPDGAIYIADTGNDRIRKVGPDGIIRTVAGTGTYRYSGDGGPAVLADLYAPVGLALAPGGSLYFSERDNHTVRMVTPQGVLIAVAGRGGIRGDQGDGGPSIKAQLNDPEGIAFGPAGDLYIADAGNHRVRVLSPGGSAIKTL